MATRMSALHFPSPKGVQARFYGSPGGSTTYYYYVQAIYIGGTSLIQAANSVGSAPAALDAGNFILIGWNPMPGAIGYNIFKSTSATVPTISATLQAFVSQSSYTDRGDAALNTSAFVCQDGLRVYRARYDFAIDGDPLAPGLITLANSDTLPKGLVITNGTLSAKTAFAGASATIAVGTSAGSAANSIKTATAITSFGTDVINSWTGTKFRMSADGTITLTSATAALTAGTLDIIIEGVMAVSF